MIKGYTVHYELPNGATACGATPRRFQGKRAATTNPRYVTCRRCELETIRKTHAARNAGNSAGTHSKGIS